MDKTTQINQVGKPQSGKLCLKHHFQSVAQDSEKKSVHDYLRTRDSKQFRVLVPPWYREKGHTSADVRCSQSASGASAVSCSFIGSIRKTRSAGAVPATEHTLLRQRGRVSCPFRFLCPCLPMKSQLLMSFVWT